MHAAAAAAEETMGDPLPVPSKELHHIIFFSIFIYVSEHLTTALLVRKGYRMVSVWE